MKPPEKAGVSSIDGMTRLPSQEIGLNELAAVVFSTASGAEFLAYLKSISLNVVMGPQASDAELRQREGMRTIVAIIESRIRQHQQMHVTKGKDDE